MGKHSWADNNGAQGEDQKTEGAEGWPPPGEKPDTFLDEILGESQETERKHSFQDSFSSLAAGAIQVMVLVLLFVVFIKLIIWIVTL